MICAEIGYKSINHAGEQLCGDHVDVVEQGEDSMVIVLADGLGSGVKASILSHADHKIISTMMAQGAVAGGLRADHCRDPADLFGARRGFRPSPSCIGKQQRNGADPV